MVIAIELGLLFAVMSLGVYLTYRVLDFPDLTVDGSYTTGAAVTAILIVNGVPFHLAIPLAIVVRMTRASVIDVLGEDYVRTANAKGLAPGLITRRHVLHNALPPVITVIGLQTGALLAGAVLTERVFAINGIGSYLFEAISNLDFAVLQGFIVFIALVYALVNLVVDLLYGLIDPRLRTR